MGNFNFLRYVTRQIIDTVFKRCNCLNDRICSLGNRARRFVLRLIMPFLYRFASPIGVTYSNY